MPGIIHKYDEDAINYFKSFGALLFDDKLEKKSVKDRVA
jgi:hypothetical protein